MSAPALSEAAAWRLLSCLLERPRDSWREEVAVLAREVGDPALAEAAARAASEASEGAYLAVLGPGGSVSPRQVAYEPERDPAAILAQLATLYDAFAYRPAGEDPPDHIAVELGFAGFLALKGAWAATQGDATALATLQRATELFRREHLDAFAGALGQRLATTHGYLATSGLALAEFVRRGLDPLG
ncbi:MAG: molecular chaperone TorD family protein [Acidobacteriota bacterium]|jgi:nitrate reductase assembly molybdenum cofactor insertion protein NarJ